MGIESLSAYHINNSRFDTEQFTRLNAGQETISSNMTTEDKTPFPQLLENIAAEKNKLPQGAGVQETVPVTDKGDFFPSSYREKPNVRGQSRAISGVNNVNIDRTDKLYESCRELETFFLKTLVNGMRKTIEKSDLNQSGFAGEMYEDMLYDEYTKEFAKNAGFGFADLAYLELTHQRGQLINHAM
ncbi:MAG: rod-binding protein [Spirochaetaceae bacterium]|jgi:flagellar protein FlgJ|nr:rod-binding protein [Spirochaetaceae bacterium]